VSVDWASLPSVRDLLRLSFFPYPKSLRSHHKESREKISVNPKNVQIFTFLGPYLEVLETISVRCFFVILSYLWAVWSSANIKLGSIGVFGHLFALWADVGQKV